MEANLRAIFSDHRNDLIERWTQWIDVEQDLPDTPSESGHQSWMSSFTHLVKQWLEQPSDRTLMEFTSSLVQKGYLSRFKFGDIVKIFLVLPKAVQDVTRVHFDEELPSGALMNLLEPVLTEACRAYEEGLCRSEEKFETLFDNADLLILHIEPSGRISKINRRGARFLGLEPVQAVGMQLSHLVHHQDLQILTRSFGHVLAGNPQIFAIRAMHAEGFAVNLDMTLTPEFEGGRIAGMRAIARNVTEQIELQQKLAESERMFRSLIEKSGDAILLIGVEDGGILDANKQARVMTGLSKQAVCARSVMDLFDREDQKTLIEMLQETITTGSSFVDGLLLINNAGPNWIVEMRSSVIAFGGMRVIQSFVKDTQTKHISERRLAEQNRRVAELELDIADLKAQLNELERPRRTWPLLLALTERIGHDARNPDHDFGTGPEGHLSHLMDATRAILRPTRNGKDPVLISVTKLIEHYVELFDYIYQGHPAFTVKSAEVPLVMVDLEGFETTLMSMLNASMEASLTRPQPRVALRVELRGRMVSIEINDSGRPLNAFERDSLFNAEYGYFEMNDSTVEDARKYLESYGGGLLVQGAPAGGNIVTLFIPAQHSLDREEPTDYHLVPLPEKKSRKASEAAVREPKPKVKSDDPEL